MNYKDQILRIQKEIEKKYDKNLNLQTYEVSWKSNKSPAYFILTSYKNVKNKYKSFSIGSYDYNKGFFKIFLFLIFSRNVFFAKYIYFLKNSLLVIYIIYNKLKYYFTIWIN